MLPQSISTYFTPVSRWMRRHGNFGDVIISSRVRLARNFTGRRFPGSANATELVDTCNYILELLENVGDTSNVLQNAGILSFADFADWERQSLVERYLTSRDHIERELGRVVVAVPDASLSLLINEEDHLRLQSLLPGLQLESALALANKLDDAIEQASGGELAFDATLGYLTACPTNMGTAMRASVMLHLPALELTGHISQAKTAADARNFVLRGTFGEGSKAYGHLYQLSNQITLGESENAILQEVEEVAGAVAEMERTARRNLADSASPVAQDAIARAYGTLQMARRISSPEASIHLSFLRLGTYLGWVKGLSHQRFNELMVNIRPACLQVSEGRAMDGAQRDEGRAALLRNVMGRVSLCGVLSRANSGRAPL